MLTLSRWWQVPYYWAGIKAYDFVSGDECLKVRPEKKIAQIMHCRPEGGGFP